ncbi:MAG TPA: hypothetical protein PLV72_00620 [Candidatus Magasanikbacteria bacterium]|nr:hypothetical protein [Candidatus Magasanikbacteria bacterium]
MNKKSGVAQFEKYEDPSGELPTWQFKLARWYIAHKLKMRRMVVWVLGVFCVVTIGYGIFGWGYYAVVGYYRDKAMLALQVEEASNFANVAQLTGARPLEIGVPTVYSSVTDKVDFITLVRNPNSRWVADVEFKYVFADGETPAVHAFVLPGVEMPLSYFGHTVVGAYPSIVDLKIINVSWKKVNAHLVPDVTAFGGVHANFLVEDFAFTQAGTVSESPTNRIQFILHNNSPYSYWEGRFYVELLSGGTPVGVFYVSVNNFRANERRVIDVRSLSNGLYGDDVRVVPLMNIFDPSEYMAVGA